MGDVLFVRRVIFCLSRHLWVGMVAGTGNCPSLTEMPAYPFLFCIVSSQTRHSSKDVISTKNTAKDSLNTDTTPFQGFP